MRFLRIDLRAYGPFTEEALELGHGRGLHLVGGPNEAGKSSLLRAIADLLFGIPEQTQDNFHHGYTALRLGATLEDDRGERLSFVRRKARKTTLYDEQDQRAIDPEWLTPYLHGLDRERFAAIFGIDQAILRRGGEQILQGQGEVGALLFGAAAGLADLRTIRRRLQEGSESLFKPRAQKPTINALLAEIDGHRKGVQEQMLPDSRYNDSRQRLEDFQSRSDSLCRQIGHHRREVGRLRRLAEAAPRAARRAWILAELAKLAQVPRLSDDFDPQWQSAQMEMHQVERRIAEADDQITRIGETLATLQVETEVLNRAEAIESLYQQIERCREDRKNKTVLVGRIREARGDVRAVLRSLGRSPVEDETLDHGIDDLTRLRIKSLSQEKADLGPRLEAAALTVERIEDELASLDDQVRNAPPIDDLPRLVELLDRVSRQGDLKAQLEEAQRSVEKLQRQVHTRLQRLAGWSGSADDLATSAMPSPEMVQDWAERMSQTEQAHSKIRQRIEDLRAGRDETSRRLNQVSHEGPLPRREDLDRARQVRDDLWVAIRQRLVPEGQIENSPGSERIRDGESEPFERAIADADAVADQLRDGAERILTRDQCEAELQSIAEQLRMAEANHASLDQKRSEDARAWRDLWTCIGVEPGSPASMIRWLDERETLLNLVEERASANHARDHLQAEVERVRAQLTTLVDEDPGDLEGLLDRAHRRRRSWEEQDRHARQLAAALLTLKQKHREARLDRQRLDHRLSDWRSRWAEAMEQIGQPPSTTTEEADLVCERLVKLGQDLHEIRQKTGTLKHIDSLREKFDQQTRQLATELDGDLATPETIDLVLALYERLDEAKRASETSQGQLKLLEQTRQRRDRAIQELGQVNLQCEELLSQAGCRDRGEIPKVQESDRRRRELEAELRRVEADLTQLGGVAGLTSLLGELESIDADALPHQMSEIEAEIAKLEAQRTEVDRQVGSAQNDLDRMDGSAAAAEANDRLESAQAELATHVEHYARLKLAEALLREAVDRYRKANQGPLIERASQIFARLTAGSFVQLDVDLDPEGDQTILFGLRPDGRRLAAAAMSDGSRDQLYLAVRLASLEAYLDRHGPMPLIVDDLLIHFDDTRALAALTALRDLGRRTQVLFLTHHQHLVGLAQAHLGDDGITYHHLDSLASRKPASVIQDQDRLQI